MSGYTSRGSNFAIFIFVSLFSGSQLLKERICSSRSKFFLFRVDFILEGLCHPGKQRESQKLLKAKKHGGGHSYLNPIALRKAKIIYSDVYSFGLSECNRVECFLTVM